MLFRNVFHYNTNNEHVLYTCVLIPMKINKPIFFVLYILLIFKKNCLNKTLTILFHRKHTALNLDLYNLSEENEMYSVKSANFSSFQCYVLVFPMSFFSKFIKIPFVKYIWVKKKLHFMDIYSYIWITLENCETILIKIVILIWREFAYNLLQLD